ncbi:MAG: clostripain-related cysteine peptidase [Candidatus Wallbacteria bacterium]|nr:clostripain-related cysteine peptidase [Candidatus Wallbacteria bacterium]
MRILSIYFFLFWAGIVFSSEKEWTFMVFLNGDNNLESFAIQDFNEMEKTGSGENLNLVVQFDRCEWYDDSNGNWTDTRRYYVEKDSDESLISSPELENLGEVDMGSSEELVKFVEWAKTEYPARHYCLVLWDHGDGWRNEAEKRYSCLHKGISIDITSSSRIDTPALGEAVKKISDVLGQKLDLVVFDACLMQMMEIAAELERSAAIMIGSEHTEPGEGIPYDRILPAFLEGKSARECSVSIVREYINFYKEQAQESYSGNWWLEATYSAIDLGKYKGLREATDRLAQVLSDNLPEVKAEILKVQQKVQRYDMNDYIDLYHFAYLLNGIGNQKIRDACSGVIDYFKDSGIVIANGYNETRVKNSYGIAVWFPLYTRYIPNFPVSLQIPFSDEFAASYARLKLAQDGRWDEMLAAYHKKAE